MKTIFFAFCLLALLAWPANAVMHLQLMTNDTQGGAVCLDGSPGGFYWRPASSLRSSKKFVLHLVGGGWCYSEADCVQRAKGALGSSKQWPASKAGSGILSADPTVNPYFHDWNVAMLQYCDGASYSGNRTEPVTINNSTIYFRGHLVFDAFLKSVAALGMDSATDVIVNGCSAGGLGVFLHLDEVDARFPHASVKGLPDSGYFLDSANVDGVAVYSKQMRDVFHFQQCEGGVDKSCVEHYSSTPGGDVASCMFAQHVYPHISARIMPLQSKYDSWQEANIWFVDTPAASSCGLKGPEQCSQREIDQATNFAHVMENTITMAPPCKSKLNGVFLDSCWQHCSGGQNDHWMRMAVNGVTMRDAVAIWAFDTEPNRFHIYLDCFLDKDRDCNPTCNA
jgi:Pectinacetylesterase